jgi:uncharacterized Ntn-hydrolase superfamily protein
VTYSIVARDPDTGALGVGLQSHFLAAGSVATFAEAGVGAISSQAFASRQYGPLGLELLRSGFGAEEVLDSLLRLDPRNEVRQVGMVDSDGGSAAWTGSRCVVEAGHRLDKGLSAQGNMLASGDVWEAMVEAYGSTAGDFPTRLLAALDAAEAAGGDARGRQSAHLYIVAGERSSQPWNGVLYDVRVDDHAAPLPELRRIVDLRRTYLRIGAVLFDDGPLFRSEDQVDQAELDFALAQLEEMEAELDGANHEPSLWRAVLLARSGRVAEGSRLLSAPLASQPSLAVFVRGLAAAGYLPAAAAEGLLAAGGVR